MAVARPDLENALREANASGDPDRIRDARQQYLADLVAAPGEGENIATRGLPAAALPLLLEGATDPATRSELAADLVSALRAGAEAIAARLPEGVPAATREEIESYYRRSASWTGDAEGQRELLAANRERLDRIREAIPEAERGRDRALAAERALRAQLLGRSGRPGRGR